MSVDASVLEIEFEVQDAPEGAVTLMERVAQCCCAEEGVAGVRACVRVIDDEEIRRVNRETRGLDRATDVLSFPTVRYPEGRTARDVPRRLHREYDPGIGRCFVGDVLISLPRAREQAETYGHSLARELGFLTAHAMFHLMGYDHMQEQERAAMRTMEERALRRAGLQREEENS